MPNDTNARLLIRNWDGSIIPVGWEYGNASPMPAKLSNVQTDPYGSLHVATDPTIAFADPFDGVVFDTINRWNTYGSVAAAQTQGNLAINPSTTASATVAVASQPLINIGLQVQVAMIVKFESGTTALGNHRFFGLGTAPSNVGTAAAPLTDAVGFEIDTSGVLRASVYDTGTRVFTQALTMPTDGLSHILMMYLRGDLAMFYLDDMFTAVATTYTGPASSNLPVRLASLNSASVTAATPTMVVEAMGVMDPCRLAPGVSDGTYPWRKVRIDPQGAMSVAPRAADLAVTAVGTSGNAVTCTIPAAGAGTYHYICSIDIVKYCTLAIVGSATPTTVTTTNVPGSLAYTFDTAQVIGSSIYRHFEYGLPLKSSVANTATTVVCPATTSVIWRVNVSYYATL